MTQKEYKENIIDKFVLKIYETNLYLQGKHLLYLIKPKNTEYNDSRLIITYNVEDASQSTPLYFYNTDRQTIGVNMFDKVEIDGTEVSVTDLDSASGAYQLSSGEHTVAYTLKDPTLIGYGSKIAFGALFGDCAAITNVVIPNSVTSIGSGAFTGCTGITSVTIGDGVTRIGDLAFGSCTGLTSVTIPNSVTSIGGSAFKGCSNLTSIVIPNSETSIGNYAFCGCPLDETSKAAIEAIDPDATICEGVD